MCGIFGISNSNNAVELTYNGLHSLQHRGQESAGIAVFDNNNINCYKNLGLVQSVFKNNLDQLNGNYAIGHVRYSTTGDSTLVNSQPFIFGTKLGKIGIVHNGNITNYEHLKYVLENRGVAFYTNSDTELFIHLLLKSKKSTLKDKLIETLNIIEGAYSVIILMRDKLIAARDPNGYRPLCIGYNDSSFAISSETAALDCVGYKYIRDIRPGEIAFINNDLISSYQFAEANLKFCLFEYIYFARPDSYFNNENDSIYEHRKKCGIQLYNEDTLIADENTIVIPVPDSGTPAALGYATAAQIPLEFGLLRSHYLGRTFIQPYQKSRESGVKLKLSPVKKVLTDKKIIIIDDSIVRGTTSKQIAQMIRECGVQEIHMRIASPSVIFPCYFGIDTPQQSQLIAHKLSLEELRKYIGVDSLKYLSLQGLIKTLNNNKFCHTCFKSQ